MIRLVLCRHSIRQSTTDVDCSITEEGVNLIDERMKDIKQFITNPSIIYTSPYKRTLETSFCIESHFDSKPQIIIENDIRETIFHKKLIETLDTPLKKLIKNNSNVDDNTFEKWNDVSERSTNLIKNKSVLSIIHIFFFFLFK